MQLDSEEWFSHEQHVRLVRISLRREGEDILTLSFSNTSFRERVFSIVYTVRGGVAAQHFVSSLIVYALGGAHLVDDSVALAKESSS